MALKTCNNKYIKLNLDGSFIIYATTEDRLAEKATENWTTISAKYVAILRTLRCDRERIYYDPDFILTIKAWAKEYDCYQQSCHQGKVLGEFPLMSQKFPDILKSIPAIICQGQVRVKGSTLEEVYNYVKQHKLFGEVVDC